MLGSEEKGQKKIPLSLNLHCTGGRRMMTKTDMNSVYNAYYVRQ